MRHGAKLIAEMQVNLEDHEDGHGRKKAVVEIKSGLLDVVSALSNGCHYATVELCLPGSVWMMLEESGLDIEETISEILTHSMGLRQRWLESNAPEAKMIATALAGKQ